MSPPTEPTEPTEPTVVLSVVLSVVQVLRAAVISLHSSAQTGRPAVGFLHTVSSHTDMKRLFEHSQALKEVNEVQEQVEPAACQCEQC